MIQGIKFDYNKIINKAEKIDKKVDLKSKNVKYMKKLPLGAFYCGLIVTLLVSGPVLTEVFISDMSLLTAILILLSVLIILTVWCLAIVAGKMNVVSYIKLKKIIKNNDYEVYKYLANIQAKYISKGFNTRSSLDYPMGWTGETTNGIKLIIDNQEIYLDGKTYKEIMFDKEIILYFAKKDDVCILYDYERIEK